MKRFLNKLLKGLDFLLTLIVDWVGGLLLLLFITILAFVSWLIAGRKGVIRFYKGYSEGLHE